MGRFFCAFLLCALLLGAAGRIRRDEAQPVFFSLLFPQLVQEEALLSELKELAWWEAVFL